MDELFEDEIEFENQVIDEEYMDKLCEYIDIIDEDYVYFESNEECANITSNKDNSEIKSSGHYSKITSTGDGAKITSTGGGAKITSSGDGAKITSTEDCAEINSSGEDGQITSSGDFANITSTGYGAKITSNGESAHIISSGYNAEINITGENSIVFVLGRNSMVKAKNGTRITMCEHIEAYSIFTLSVQIGNEEYKDYKGRTLNENEYYCLHHEEIYPVDISDGIKTIKISEKKKDGITIIKGQELYENGKIFIVKDNEIDNIVDKTIELIANDDYEYDNGYFYMDKYFLNKKDYMKLLINGEITNTQRKIHDLIEEYQLKENKKFMIKLIWLDGRALKYASEELQIDKEAVIEYASKYEVQNDEELKRLYENYDFDFPF